MEHVHRRSDPFGKMAMNRDYKELAEATRATMRDEWSQERFANTLQSFMSPLPERKEADADYVNTMIVRGLRCAAEEQRAHRSEVKCEARAAINEMVRKRNDAESRAERRAMWNGRHKQESREKAARIAAGAISGWWPLTSHACATGHRGICSFGCANSLRRNGVASKRVSNI